MPNPQVQNDSIIAVMPYLYKYGFQVMYGSTTTLTISAGQCRDSSNIIDMGAGSLFPPPSQQSSVSAPLTLNAAVNGVNGLDTGSLTLNRLYSVYIIGDSRYYNPVGCILSLATNSTPLLPFGYDSYRLIGYWGTNSSSQFYPGSYSSSHGDLITFMYDAPQGVLSNGSATSYTAVALTNLTPSVNNVLVNLQYNFNPNAAADTFKLQSGNSTGDNWTYIAPVAGATAHSVGFVTLNSQLVSSVPTVKYLVGAGTDQLSLFVSGFTVAV